MTSIFSFLGGSVFRMLWGEVSAWLTKQQDHAHEIERMRLQGVLDAEAQARNLQALRVQADLGVKVIQAQSEAHGNDVLMDGWLEAVLAVGRSTGIAWVDAWNAVIRPSVATWAVIMLTLGECAVLTLSDSSLAICSAALGIYLAERNLLKRGK